MGCKIMRKRTYWKLKRQRYAGSGIRTWGIAPLKTLAERLDMKKFVRILAVGTVLFSLATVGVSNAQAGGVHFRVGFYGGPVVVSPVVVPAPAPAYYYYPQPVYSTPVYYPPAVYSAPVCYPAVRVAYPWYAPGFRVGFGFWHGDRGHFRR